MAQPIVSAGAELASSKPCPQAVRSSPHKLTQTKKASAVKAGTASEAKQAHTAASQLPQGQAKTPEVDLVPKAAEPAVDVPADAGEDMHEEWDIMAVSAAQHLCFWKKEPWAVL